MDLLKTLQQELGTAYLFISHDLRVLLKICDRLLVMHEGRLIEQADHLADLDEFSHESFWQLLDAILPPAPPAAGDVNGAEDIEASIALGSGSFHAGGNTV